jgi:hypothetical protein
MIGPGSLFGWVPFLLAGLGVLWLAANIASLHLLDYKLGRQQ